VPASRRASATRGTTCRSCSSTRGRTPEAIVAASRAVLLQPPHKRRRKRHRHCAKISKGCNNAYAGFVGEPRARKRRRKEKTLLRMKTAKRTGATRMNEDEGLGRGTKGTDT